jgi:hypothetical protein
MTLQTAIAQLQTTLGALSGIRGAPEYVPDNTAVFPFIVAYAGPGEFRAGEPPGMMKYLGSIIVDLHLARKDLPRDIEKAMTYHDAIPNAILSDTTLGGTVSTMGAVSSSGLIFLKYAETDTIGIRFTLENVKIQADLT